MLNQMAVPLPAIRRGSFFAALQLMEPERRQAMEALYGFCRLVDDIADSSQPASHKLIALDGWQEKLDSLQKGHVPHGLEMLADAVRRYALNPVYLNDILEGMRMDARGEMLRPDQALLERYCYRVAGCVGLLSIAIFGCRHPDSEHYAVELGHALQLTNIMRDIREDAHLHRIYLPQEWLDQAGLGMLKPQEVERHTEALRPVLLQLHHKALSHYEALAQWEHPQDADALTPARLMRDTYFRLLMRMQRDGWRYQAPYRIGAADKLALLMTLFGVKFKRSVMKSGESAQ